MGLGAKRAVTAAVAFGMLGGAAAACESGPNTQSTPNHSSSPAATADWTRWTRSCEGLAAGVRYFIDTTNPAVACAFGLEVKAALDAQPPHDVSIAGSNGWFINPQREACISSPIVGTWDGRGVMAAARLGAFSGGGAAEVAVIDISGGGPLPTGPAVQTITPRVENGHYVTDWTIPNPPAASMPIAKFLVGPDCK